MERLNLKEIPSVGPFSTAIKANGFLFVSGLAGTDQLGNLVEGFENEVDQILVNLHTILVAAGLGFSDVVTVVVYLKDMDNFKKLNEVYKKYFTEGYPTRTCIAVADLPVCAAAEMTVTAVLKD